MCVCVCSFVQSSIFVVGAASFGAAALDLFYIRHRHSADGRDMMAEYQEVWHYWLMAMPGIVIGTWRQNRVVLGVSVYVLCLLGFASVMGQALCAARG